MLLVVLMWTVDYNTSFSSPFGSNTTFCMGTVDYNASFWWTVEECLSTQHSLMWTAQSITYSLANANCRPSSNSGVPVSGGREGGDGVRITPVVAGQEWEAYADHDSREAEAKIQLASREEGGGGGRGSSCGGAYVWIYALTLSSVHQKKTDILMDDVLQTAVATKCGMYFMESKAKNKYAQGKVKPNRGDIQRPDWGRLTQGAISIYTRIITTAILSFCGTSSWHFCSDLRAPSLGSEGSNPPLHKLVVRGLVFERLCAEKSLAFMDSANGQIRIYFDRMESRSGEGINIQVHPLT